MSNLEETLAVFRQRMAGQRPASATMSQRDPIHDIRDNDEWLAAIKARRAANKHSSYVRYRPTRYETASYAALTSQQDPGGKISRWLDSGPRALLLAGPSRTGKTTAAYAIANAAHAAGVWTYARTTADLSAAFKPGGELSAYEYAAGCDLLVLDDLGRERETDWWLEQLQRLLEDRCANKRRLIVTANTPTSDPKDPKKTPAAVAFDSLAVRYGHPLVERILDGGGLIVLDGPAVRDLVTEW